MVMDAGLMDALVKMGAVGVLGIVVWHLMGMFRVMFFEKRWEKNGAKTPPRGYPFDFGPNQISDRVVYDVSVSLSKLVVGQEQQTKVVNELVTELRSNRNMLLKHASQTTDFIRSYGKKLTGEMIPTDDVDGGF